MSTQKEKRQKEGTDQEDTLVIQETETIRIEEIQEIDIEEAQETEETQEKEVIIEKEDSSEEMMETEEVTINALTVMNTDTRSSIAPIKDSLGKFNFNLLIILEITKTILPALSVEKRVISKCSALRMDKRMALQEDQKEVDIQENQSQEDHQGKEVIVQDQEDQVFPEETIKKKKSLRIR